MRNWSVFGGLFGPQRVTIFADFIDPFCYIGFHNLKLVANLKSVPLAWQGFEFNPDTPPEGYWLQSGANSDLRPGMWASVLDYAAKAGLNFSQPERMPNTRLAHNLVARIQTDVKISLIERIYQAYFIEKRDISDRATLVSAAKDCGIVDKEAALSFTGADRATDHERNRKEAVDRKFPGMPGFVFRNQIHFGALSQQAWQNILESKTANKESVCSTK